MEKKSKIETIDPEFNHFTYLNEDNVSEEKEDEFDNTMTAGELFDLEIKKHGSLEKLREARELMQKLRQETGHKEVKYGYDSGFDESNSDDYGFQKIKE